MSWHSERAGLARRAPRGSSEWMAKAAEIGIPEFPADYVEFVNSYGQCNVGSFLWILDPFAMDYRGTVDWLEEILRTSPIVAESGLGVFPAPGGLFPWGRTDNGDVVTWKTTGLPAAWSVVGIERDGLELDAVDFGVVAYLEAVFDRRYRPSFFPDDIP